MCLVLGYAITLFVHDCVELPSLCHVKQAKYHRSLLGSSITASIPMTSMPDLFAEIKLFGSWTWQGGQQNNMQNEQWAMSSDNYGSCNRCKQA